MLISLQLETFKAFDREIVPLEPFSVFVGRNGSGKTSVLQAVEFLHGLVAADLGVQLERHSWAYRDLPHLGSASAEFGFGALIELDGQALWWHVRMGKRRYHGIAQERIAVLDSAAVATLQEGNRLPSSGVRSVLERNGRTMKRLDERNSEWESITQTLTSSWLALVDPVRDQDRFPALASIADWARSIQPYVVLDPNRLREPSALSRHGIGVAGERLAGFLRHLRSSRPEAFERVMSRVQSAYPRLEELVIQQEGSAYRLAVRESWSETNPLLNARQVSDGLLRLFALAALPESRPEPSLVMIDELENGVHPELLGALVGMLDDLSQSSIQILATSHSPLVLNYVSEPSSVFLTTRSEGGAAKIERLDRTPGYDRLAGTFSAGEMWLARGEDGLIAKAKG